MAVFHLLFVLNIKKLLKEYTLNQVVILNMNWKWEHQWVYKVERKKLSFIIAVSSCVITELVSLQIVYYRTGIITNCVLQENMYVCTV